MSTLFYGPQQVALNFQGGNHFLANLQVATIRRFDDTGRGYSLTLAGESDNGERITNSYWLHPSIPMVFKYDTVDVTGEPPKTVTVREDDVQILLEAMDRYLGVLWGFSEGSPYLPFMWEEAAAELDSKQAAAEAVDGDQ
jgi:hypothetical protein